MTSIRETVHAVRTGATTALANAERVIRCHQASELGAYIHFDAEGALSQATAIDAAVANGEDPGPLAGVTVSVKDLYGMVGLPIRAGSTRPLPPRWQREGFLVTALRKLGAVLVGKTHTVEFAFAGVGLNPHTGTPINPWDAKEHRVPGGSSSGAGVSLWEGSAHIALGTDTGGSIRIPASATGVVGSRQSTGRWPTTGVVPLSSTMDTVGVLTHTVADLRHVFGLIDPLANGSPAPQNPPADLSGLRIGVPWSSPVWRQADPHISAVAKAALEEVQAAGAVLCETRMPEIEEAAAFYLERGFVAAECMEFLDRELPEWVDLLHPIVGSRLASGRSQSAIEYLTVLRARPRLSATVHRRMEEEKLDLLATPTVPVPPPLLADLDDLEEYGRVNRSMLSATGPFSMMDMCAVSVPVGLDDLGLPVGLQLVGRTGADYELLDWAALVEAEIGGGRERLGLPARLRQPDLP